MKVFKNVQEIFLSADAALLLFNELPSDNDSTVSSESCSDEEVLPQSDLGDTENVHNFHSGTDEEDDTNFPSQTSEVK